MSCKKLLILDIDGTLAKAEKEISPATKAAVIELMKRGHLCMLASGRPLCGMEWAARELEFDRYGGYLLSYNGALIVKFDTMETVYEKKVPVAYLREIYDCAIEHDCGIISYEGNTVISGHRMSGYIERELRINDMTVKEVDNFPDYFRDDVVKCMWCIEPDRAEALEKKMKRRMGDRVSVYRSEPYYVEAMPLGVDKATSIAHMLPLVGLTREDCVACGDSFNDITMIRYAGVGVAMGNAKQAVKEAADVITGTNEEDGLIPVIKKYFLCDEG